MRDGDFYLLVVEKGPGLYRLYVGMDGLHYAHYDSGDFKNLDDAARAARAGFDPGPFLAFPFAPLRREQVIERAPHGMDPRSN